MIAQGRALFVPKTCYWSVMSVSHCIGLSSIQWRASSSHKIWRACCASRRNRNIKFCIKIFRGFRSTGVKIPVFHDFAGHRYKLQQCSATALLWWRYLVMSHVVQSNVWEIDWYQNEWPWSLFRGRLRSREVVNHCATFAIEYIGNR